MAHQLWNNFDYEFPERIVSLDEQKRLMKQFALRLPRSTRVVGVITQPMIDKYHSLNLNPAYDDIRREYGSINAFHDQERNIHRDFFREHGFPFLDLSILMGKIPEKYVHQRDGIHMSPEGHRFFAEKMAELLKGILAADGCI